MSRHAIRTMACVGLVVALAASVSRADPQGSVVWSQSTSYIAAPGLGAPSYPCSVTCALAGPGFWVREDDGLIDLSIRDDVLPTVAAAYEFVDQGGRSLGTGTMCAAVQIQVPAAAYWLAVRPGGIVGSCSPVGTRGTITMSYSRPVAAPSLNTVSREFGAGAEGPAAIPVGARSVPVFIEGDNMNPTTNVSVSGTGVSIVRQGVYRDSGSYSTMAATVSIEVGAIPGPRDVIVSNGSGLTATCVGCLTVDPLPRIDSVTPAHGRVGRATAVMIIGANFDARADISVGPAVEGADAAPIDVSVNDVFVMNSTTITANFNVQPYSAPGARSVVVRNPDGGTASCMACFTITAV